MNTVYKKEYIKKIVEDDVLIGEYVKMAADKIGDKINENIQQQWEIEDCLLQWEEDKRDLETLVDNKGSKIGLSRKQT